MEGQEQDILDMVYLVINEMNHIWGEEGFGGDAEEYNWLLNNYAITEEDDVKWVDILKLYTGHYHDLRDELDEIDGGGERAWKFLNDREAVHDFLNEILNKYRANSVTYPRE